MTNSFIKYKNIISELARKNIRTQYRGSVLGFLWTILNPLLTMLVMWIVFSQFFGKDDPYYPIYLLAGNILFTALRNATSQSLTSIYNNRGLLLRTKVEPYIFPCSYVVSNLVNFLLSLLALVPFMIWLSIAQGLNLFTFRLLFIFLMLPAFWLFQYGIGLFLSVLYVFVKDILHLYTVFLVLWNYITPIFYKPIEGNEFVNFVINATPMYYFVTYFRDSVYSGSVTNTIPSWTTLAILYGFGILSFLIGYGVYRLSEENICMKL